MKKQQCVIHELRLLLLLVSSALRYGPQHAISISVLEQMEAVVHLCVLQQTRTAGQSPAAGLG